MPFEYSVRHFLYIFLDLLPTLNMLIACYSKNTISRFSGYKKLINPHTTIGKQVWFGLSCSFRIKICTISTTPERSAGYGSDTPRLAVALPYQRCQSYERAIYACL